MKKAIYSVAALAFLASCQTGSDGSDTEAMDRDTTTVIKEQKKEPSLTLEWETDTVLITNESVYYDKDNNRLFVSNISGKPTDKDGDGSISILGTDGTIKENVWVSGLDAPKGMGVHNGRLYVTNIDELVAIDIAKKEIVKRYKVNGAKFLNDVAVANGKVYFSDSQTGKLYVLEGDNTRMVMRDVKNLNGIYYDGEEMYGLDDEGFRKYNINGDRVAETINADVTGGDGLVKVADNVWLASRWDGEIWLIQNGVATKLLDSKAEGLQTADITYIPEKNLVLVPRFFGNKVSAYKLSY